MRFDSIRHFFTRVAYTILVGLLILPSSISLAAGEQLLVDPPSSTMSTDTTFTITVRGYSDISGVSANGTLTYPQNLLTVTNTSSDGMKYRQLSQGL